MSTSNSYDFSMTTNEIVEKALYLIGAYTPMDQIQTEYLNLGRNFLNMMIKSWEVKEIYIWCQSEGIVFFTVGTKEYTLSPSGDEATDISTYHKTALDGEHNASDTALTVTSTSGMTIGDRIGIENDDGDLHWTTIATIPDSTSLTITTGLDTSAPDGGVVYTYTSKIQKPIKIISARVRDNNDLDREVTMMDRTQYMIQATKFQSGSPTSYFYQPNVLSGSLMLYRVPDTVREVLHIDYLRQIQDFDNPTDDPDFPSQWLETLVWNLALRLCPVFGKTGVAESIKVGADTLFNQLKAWSYGQADTIIQPYFEP